MENKNPQEINNLKVFGNVFQTKCIAALVSDRAFLERIVDILSPEYFETDAHKWVIELVVNYFLQYKEIPTKEVFKVKMSELSNSQEVLKESIRSEITSAFKFTLDSTDALFVKEQFLAFCKQMKLKKAILRSAELLNNGDYESIKHEIDEAMRAGMERNLGHEYLVEIDKRMSLMARDCIPTGWDIIDKRLDGGLGKGELGFIVAPAGSGKSWLLVRMGGEAIKRGKNVLHVTLELNEHYVGLRYDAFFTGIAFQEVRKNIPIVKSKIEEMKNGEYGQLWVKYFPLKTVSPQTLKMHIDRLQLITGKKVDMLVVDYADILRPFMADKNANSYSEAGSVYEELRQIAGELQIPVWSASQSNRGAHEADTIEAHNVADSYRKIMTGDFILSLSRKKEDKAANTGRLHTIKNRFGSDGETFALSFDTSTGVAKVCEMDSPEGRELMSRAKEYEQNIQDLLKAKWNEHKGNGGAGTDMD